MAASAHHEEHAPPRFNLVRDPWICVRMVNGDLAELSLLDVFDRLEQVESLAGEASVQDVALLRLLLAITHSALGPSTERDHDPEFDRAEAGAIAEWASIWKDRSRLRDAAQSYLGDWASRFELFDAERPFYQVAGLTTGKAETGPLVRFVFDVPNDEDKQYFTMRAGSGLKALSFAEAARWLVTTQAFDTSGIKSGVQGDPRTKGGKGYPIGPARAAQLGVVFARGATLEETILLNLVRGNAWTGEWHSNDAVSESDVAPWEREGDQVIGVGVRPGTLDDLAHVEGVVDALTWQARRLRLQHDGTQVVGVIIANGDRANTDNQFAIEHMTPWRQPLSGVGSKTAPLVLKPRRHDVEQALWRGLPGVLPGLTADTDGRGRALKAPGAIQWIATLQAHGALPSDRRIGVHALGLKLDTNNAIVQDVYDDHLDLSAALVATGYDARRLAQAIEREARATEQAVLALGKYAENLALAAGNRDSDVRKQALERGYFAVDAPFRSWIGEIGIDMDASMLDAHEARWRGRALTLIRGLGNEIADRVSAAAAEGRPGFGGKPIDMGLAERYFEFALRRALAVEAENPDGREKPVRTEERGT